LPLGGGTVGVVVVPEAARTIDPFTRGARARIGARTNGATWVLIARLNSIFGYVLVTDRHHTARFFINGNGSLRTCREYKKDVVSLYTPRTRSACAYFRGQVK
jgi:hypothetical protein